jgi:hypothetical protein
MQCGPSLRLLLLLPWISTAQQTAPAGPPQSGAAIQVVEGDGAINSIRLHRGHDPVVRVVTPDGKPIAGAATTFLLPATGPSGSFGDSGLSLTVTTDARGIAAAHGLRPNGVAGQFRIRVTTSWRGSPAVATLAQTNAEPVVHASHTKTIVILVVVAGAVIGGAAAAVGHSGSSSSSSSSPGATVGGSTAAGSIISGTPSIGPPH